MNQGRINKALLFIINEAGGLAPGQLEAWIGQLKKAGYVTHTPREMTLKGDNGRPEKYTLPYTEITEEGKARL